MASSAAYEIETGEVDFADPPQTKTFRRAAFNGERFPIQACLYLAHRARIYILKAVVDYWLARERGEIKKTKFKFGEVLIDLSSGQLTSAMASGIEELSAMKSFRLFPVFWQVFLWSWGGFLLKDRLEEEYESLSRETSVPVAEIPVALGAFDKLFPVPKGWFREPEGDARMVLILTPAAMRGVGAFRRRLRYSVEDYTSLGLDYVTTNRMVQDNNTGARLLDCADRDLVK